MVNTPLCRTFFNAKKNPNNAPWPFSPDIHLNVHHLSSRIVLWHIPSLPWPAISLGEI